MNITILCVGKLKERYWKEAQDEYSKRLSAYCSLTVTEVKESRKDDIDEEGEALLRKLSDRDYVITLEIEGKARSSTEMAEMIRQLGIDGKSSIVFVIGGSNGLSRAVMDRANANLSFSKMTFPHQLMRVILLEQIYRSFKIIRNETYHK